MDEFEMFIKEQFDGLNKDYDGLTPLLKRGKQMFDAHEDPLEKATKRLMKRNNKKNRVTLQGWIDEFEDVYGRKPSIETLQEWEYILSQRDYEDYE